MNWILQMLLPGVRGFLNWMFASIINACWQASVGTINNIGVNNHIVNDFGNLFGYGGTSGVYTLVETICHSVVQPIALSILSAVFLMQFLKMASKTESQGTLPAFREIMVLFTMLTIFEFIVVHSLDICAGIYDLCNNIGAAINVEAPKIDAGKNLIEMPDGEWVNSISKYADIDNGTMWILFFSVFILQLGAWLAGIIVTVIVLARALQIYMMAAFSPIPMSTLGFEETRSWGIGYFKNYASVALSGAILLFILYAFPLIVGALWQDAGSSGNDDYYISLDDLANRDKGDFWKTNWFKLIGYALSSVILLIMSAVKSGSWAKDIMGG